MFRLPYTQLDPEFWLTWPGLQWLMIAVVCNSLCFEMAYAPGWHGHPALPQKTGQVQSLSLLEPVCISRPGEWYGIFDLAFMCVCVLLCALTAEITSCRKRKGGLLSSLSVSLGLSTRGSSADCRTCWVNAHVCCSDMSKALMLWITM
jgi:hypothetical protein